MTGRPIEPGRPKCVECLKRSCAGGDSATSLGARKLGLCNTCFNLPGVRIKWREKLGIVAWERGRKKSVPGAATKATEKYQIADASIAKMVDIVNDRFKKLESIHTDLEEVLDWMAPVLSESATKIKLLKIRAQAADELRAKLTTKGFEVDAMLRRFGMSVQELKSAIRGSERRDKAIAEENLRLIREREEEEKRKRSKGGK